MSLLQINYNSRIRRTRSIGEVSVTNNDAWNELPVQYIVYYCY